MSVGYVAGYSVDVSIHSIHREVGNRINGMCLSTYTLCESYVKQTVPPKYNEDSISRRPTHVCLQNTLSIFLLCKEPTLTSFTTRTITDCPIVRASVRHKYLRSPLVHLPLSSRRRFSSSVPAVDLAEGVWFCSFELADCGLHATEVVLTAWAAWLAEDEWCGWWNLTTNAVPIKCSVVVGFCAGRSRSNHALLTCSLNFSYIYISREAGKNWLFLGNLWVSCGEKAGSEWL